MNMFDYLMVLLSIIIGLALTHLMQGLARLVQHPGRERIWWVHLVWVAFMFLMTIFWWWWEFRLQRIETWTLGLYLFVVAYAFLVYLICAMLFPKDLSGYDGYKDYFLSRRRWFFGLIIAFFVFDYLDSWIKGPDHLASLGVEYYVAAAVQLPAAFVALASRRELVQATIAVGFLVYQISWSFRLFNTIS